MISIGKRWSGNIFLLVFLFSLPFFCIASDKVVVNIGYIRNGSDLVQKQGLHFFLPKTKLSGINLSIGVKNKNFVNGLYYSIGQTKQYSSINESGPSPFLVASGNKKHVFGAYSNFFLSSLLKDEKIIACDFHFYSIVKTGCYYISDIDGDGEFKPYGIDFNCFVGLGTSYYFWKKFGIFGEVGYDYYRVFDNYVKMSKFTYRVGFSLRV